MKSDEFDFNSNILNDMGYTFETISLTNAAFSRIHHSFIITMHDSIRKEQYVKQMKTYAPTKYVTIVHNRGYLNGKKGNLVNTTAKDLWHANSTIMNLCSEIDEPIVIFEDDVEFLPMFSKYANDIESFIFRKSGIGAYNLGGLPLLSYPVSRGHIRGIIVGFAHAVIYTKKGRDQLKDKNICKLHDLECSLSTNMYFPAFPLAIQKIERTENSRNWDLFGFSFCYLNCFGKHLFHIHHIIGWFGGIFGVLLLIISSLIGLLVLMFFRLDLQHH